MKKRGEEDMYIVQSFLIKRNMSRACLSGQQSEELISLKQKHGIDWGKIKVLSQKQLPSTHKCQGIWR